VAVNRDVLLRFDSIINSRRGDRMGRSLVQLYALAVCFTTLMCFVVALGIATYDVIQIASPAFTVPEYMAWQTDEQFLAWYPDKKDLPEIERTVLREQYRQNALDAERRSALQSLVFMAIILAIDSVVYRVHWRVAWKLDRSNNPTEARIAQA
jgi:hypothetical protein